MGKFTNFLNNVFDGIEDLDIDANIKVMNSSVTVNADGIGGKIMRPTQKNENKKLKSASSNPVVLNDSTSAVGDFTEVLNENDEREIDETT